MIPVDPFPVRVGDLLAGKYRVESVLGMGGMGVVVAARHEQLDQRVAIKFVRPEALGDGQAVERFLREARAAVRLKSEHAAKVLDVGTLESGAPYMVMELLEGSDLASALEQQGQVSLEQAVDWIVQACEALAEAHAAGIVHRDLKPQNLFLARTVGDAVSVKVLDFGVSKSPVELSGGGAALTHTRAMLGSPLYMAPEQMRSSRQVDARADVWALGVVLFELLSGARPFEADTLPELCLMVVGDPPRPLRSLRPELPPDVYDIVSRCLRKDPTERYADAGELADALAPFASASSLPTIERARAAARRGVRTTLVAEPVPTRLPTPRDAERPLPLTPAAWGSGASPEQARQRKRRVRLGVAAAAALLAVAGVALTSLRAPAPAPAVPLAPVVAAVPSAPSSSPLAAPPPSVLPSALPELAPAPSLVPAIATLAESRSDPRPAPVASDSAGPAARSSAPSVPSAKPSAAPRAPSKGRGSDDDIPAVR